MARSSRSRRRRGGGSESTKHAVGIALIVATMAMFAGGAYVIFTKKSSPKLDKVTNCPVDGPTATTVILLDASDVLPDVTRRELKTFLTDAALEVPAYGMLEIRLLDPASPSGSAIFSKCNLGDGSGLSEIDNNPASVRKKWRESFVLPLERSLEGALNPTSSDRSPILSTLQSIAVDRFSGNRAASMPKSLIVVSDLIEHGPGYSQYSDSLSFEAFRKTDVYKRVRTDLQGAEVKFRYIQRITRKPINSADHIRFWTDWVKDSNGRFIEARKLQGAG